MTITIESKKRSTFSQPSNFTIILITFIYFKINPSFKHKILWSSSQISHSGQWYCISLGCQKDVSITDSDFKFHKQLRSKDISKFIIYWSILSLTTKYYSLGQIYAYTKEAPHPIATYRHLICHEFDLFMIFRFYYYSEICYTTKSNITLFII